MIEALELLLTMVPVRPVRYAVMIRSADPLVGRAVGMARVSKTVRSCCALAAAPGLIWAAAEHLQRVILVLDIGGQGEPGYREGVAELLGNAG